VNVYIVADVEGAAGVVFYEHQPQNMSPMCFDVLMRNRLLLTEEVNAAAAGAVEAGADTIVVHDHHGAGYTILPDRLHPRLELIHGRAQQMMDVIHPDLDASFDALVLIGMHAKAGTVEGCTPHSLICVEDGDGRRYELSEAAMSMAVAGDAGVPCAFVAGDGAVVEEALSLSPDTSSVVTKRHYRSQLARTLSPAVSRRLIAEGVRLALQRKPSAPPFRIPGPCAVQIADRNPAARWPLSPPLAASFTQALVAALKTVPWYKPVEKIDDGWRYPDRMAPSPMPNDVWNNPWSVFPPSLPGAGS